MTLPEQDVIGKWAVTVFDMTVTEDNVVQRSWKYNKFLDTLEEAQQLADEVNSKDGLYAEAPVQVKSIQGDENA